MSKKNVEVKRIPSLIPYIIAGGVYVIGSFILPMYKLYSYIILLVLAIVVYIGIKKANVFKDEIIEIEKPIVYETSELEELVNLGKDQIKTLEQLVQVIENKVMIKDLQGIIQTSQSIINYVEENQGLEKKVRKYFRYYLDEIIKIVKQYDDFEEDPLNVEYVKVSKEKIEKTVNNANISFLKFYNDLYEGKAMDITVDLKVFDSMLKRLD